MRHLSSYLPILELGRQLHQCFLLSSQMDWQLNFGLWLQLLLSINWCVNNDGSALFRCNSIESLSMSSQIAHSVTLRCQPHISKVFISQYVQPKRIVTNDKSNFAVRYKKCHTLGTFCVHSTVYTSLKAKISRYAGTLCQSITFACLFVELISSS